MGNRIASAAIMAQEKEIMRHLEARDLQQSVITEEKIGMDEVEIFFLNYSKSVKKKDVTRHKQFRVAETIEFPANGQIEIMTDGNLVEIYGSTLSLEDSLPPPWIFFRPCTPEQISEQMKPVINLIFCCSQCKIGFSNYSKLRVHVQTFHFCFVCLRYFFDASALFEHHEEVHSDKFLSCVRCGDDVQQFVSPGSLLLHNSLMHFRNFQTNCLFCSFNDEGNPAVMWKHLDGHLLEDARSFQQKHRLPLEHSIDVYVLYGTKDSEGNEGSDTVLPVHYFIMPIEEPAEIRQGRYLVKANKITSRAAVKSKDLRAKTASLSASDAPYKPGKHTHSDSEEASPSTSRKKSKKNKNGQDRSPLQRRFSDKENIFKPIVNICRTIKKDKLQFK